LGPGAALAFQQSLDNVLALVPSLHNKMSLNVRFTDPLHFESTALLGVFETLDVKIVHGWIADTHDVETYEVVAKRMGSYARVKKAADTLTQSEKDVDETDVIVGFICSQFLDECATQLTHVGMQQLDRTIRTGKPDVFYRDNQFYAIVKSNGKLWTLVTDVAYLDHADVVWQSVDLSGKATFTDSWFGDTTAAEYVWLTKCGNGEKVAG
jgi:MINDY deubiquitinase